MTSTLPFCPQELNDKELLLFQQFCETNLLIRASGHPVCPFTIASEMGIDLANMHKDSHLITALWVAFLVINRCTLTSEHVRKYENVPEFLSAYSPRFDSYSEEESHRLFEIANWMNLFFTYVPAKKNKGLIIQVIPKVVEGWNAKYITGSGQTIATKDRVFIYESEGNVRPFQRGRLAKKRSLSITTDGSSGSDTPFKRAKKCRKSKVVPFRQKSQMPSGLGSLYYPGYLEVDIALPFSHNGITEEEDLSHDDESYVESNYTDEERDDDDAIRFSNLPPLLQRAYSLESNGDFSASLELVHDVAAPKFLRDSSAFVVADCLQNGKGYDVFNNGGNLHVYSALETSSGSHLKIGDTLKRFLSVTVQQDQTQ